MTPIATTLTGTAGTAARFHLPELVAADAAMVDQWMLTPNFNCQCRHQFVLRMQSLADISGVPPVEGVLRRYSHLVSYGELLAGPWTPEQVLTGRSGIDVRTLLNPPLLLDNAVQARKVCYELAAHLVAGVLPAYPDAGPGITVWQIAVLMAAWRALGRPGAEVRDVHRTWAPDAGRN